MVYRVHRGRVFFLMGYSDDSAVLPVRVGIGIKMTNTCYKNGEVKALWHHLWKLCKAYLTKSEAENRKKFLEQRGKISRIQTTKDENKTIYLVWWR